MPRRCWKRCFGSSGARCPSPIIIHTTQAHIYVRTCIVCVCVCVCVYVCVCVCVCARVCHTVSLTSARWNSTSITRFDGVHLMCAHAHRVFAMFWGLNSCGQSCSIRLHVHGFRFEEESETNTHRFAHENCETYTQAKRRSEDSLHTPLNGGHDVWIFRLLATLAKCMQGTAERWRLEIFYTPHYLFLQHLPCVCV